MFSDYGTVKTKHVGFVVHNGDDTEGSAIGGTLFYTGSYGPDSKLIVLVHGTGTERWFFDFSEHWKLPAAGSYARELALLGYVVLTYDRLGFGESKYRGSGKKIMLGNHIAMLHEIVTQLREGTFTEGPLGGGTRAASGFKKIIVNGESAGALIATGHAGQHPQDLDALIQSCWSHQGLSKLVQKQIGTWVIPQAMQFDYIDFVIPGEDGPISKNCLEFIFHLPGADAEVANAVCANKNLVKSPTGEALDIENTIKGNMMGRIKNIKAPVMLHFTDSDISMPGPSLAKPDDPDMITPEIGFWKAMGHDPFVYVQKNSGHVGVLHKTMPDLVKAVAGWLKSKQL
jgi:pimeloyl-ACP methyl ester carboxylesterase